MDCKMFNINLDPLSADIMPGMAICTRDK